MTANITPLNTPVLPAPTELERIELRAKAVHRLFERFHTEDGLPALRLLARDIDQAVAYGPGLLAALDAIKRPATKKELADHLSVLRIAFPTAKAAGDGFARVLIERVAARTPTFGQLDWAIRRLIDTEQFLPSVAVVVEALAAAQRSIESAEYFADHNRLLRLRRDVADRIADEGGKE